MSAKSYENIEYTFLQPNILHWSKLLMKITVVQINKNQTSSGWTQSITQHVTVHTMVGQTDGNGVYPKECDREEEEYGSIRAQKLCASQGRHPGLPIPNSSRWSLRTLSNIWRRRRTQTSRTICSSAMTQRTWVLAANWLRWHFCETYSHQQPKGDPRLTGQQRAGRPLP